MGESFFFATPSPSDLEVARPVMKRTMKVAEMNDERMSAVARMQTSWESRVWDLRNSFISVSMGDMWLAGQTCGMSVVVILSMLN